MGRPNPLFDLPGMDAHLERVDEALVEAAAVPDAFLTEVSGHLIKAGGKRQRPLFAVAAAATRSEVTHDVIMGGVAVELVQVGSLYHDDVIDEASSRRGVESVNARWGNLTAILAGDYLLAKASEIAASLGVEVAALLARTIGHLCQGEVTELRDAYNVHRTEDRYFTSIEGKTAALFSAACRIGAIVGGLRRDEIDTLTEFGRCYGMAFQIVDDVLDVTATSEQLGKPAGLDLAEGVYTLPVIRTLASPGVGDELRAILGGPIEPEAVEQARALVRSDGAVRSALVEADKFVGAGIDALAPLGESAATVALAGAARHLVDGVADAAA